jgi:hypothetical protein
MCTQAATNVQIDVILLTTSSISVLVFCEGKRPKSRLKLSCVMVVPMKALSYPYARTPIDITSAAMYTLQLYYSSVSICTLKRLH